MKSEIEVTQKGLNQGFKLAKKAILKWLGVAEMASNEVWKWPKWQNWPKSKFQKGWNSLTCSLEVAKMVKMTRNCPTWEFYIIFNISQVLRSFKCHIISDFMCLTSVRITKIHYFSLPFFVKIIISMTYVHVVMFWVSMFYVQHTFHETSKSRRPYFRMHKVWL